MVPWVLLSAYECSLIFKKESQIATFLNSQIASKFEIRKKFGFWDPPPLKKNISLKHLKLPKNHLKTNLFFLQLKYLKWTFEFGKKMKIWPPPPLLSKSPYFEFWTFWLSVLIPLEAKVFRKDNPEISQNCIWHE